MHKGFGFYSPLEATSFFLKALLLSFWLGADVIAALAMSSVYMGGLLRHGLLVFVLAVVLVSGTVFSALLVWVTGALYEVKTPVAHRNTAVAARLHSMKQKNQTLIGGGIAAVSILLIPLAVYLLFVRPGTELAGRTSRATPDVATKCFEVAHLEHALFESDASTVMAECLIQYDDRYAPLRNFRGQRNQ